MSQDDEESCDVIVVGAGAAGYAAALAAHESGASVRLIEKCGPDSAGGNTRLSGGGWFVSRSPERAAVYLRALSEGFPLPEDVVATWARETALNSDWLRGLGAQIETSDSVHTVPEYPELDGSDCYAGMDTVDGVLGSERLYTFLHNAARARGIEVCYDSPARELIEDPESAEIRGLVVQRNGAEKRLLARGGVVLATGGFEADADLVRTYLGLADVVRWGTPANTGDGLRMAQKIGADLWHMQSAMTITGIRGEGEAGYYLAMPRAVGPHSYIYVSPDARRFADESAGPRHGHVRQHGRYERFPMQSLFVIFDENLRSAGPLSPPPDLLPIGWQALMKGYHWSHDNSIEIERGWIQRADTLAELADLLGLDASRLEQTVEAYNTACHTGVDHQLGRRPETLHAISQPPYYGFHAPPLLGWTNGGPRRDGRSRVLDTFGKVIPGLYAAGSVSSTYSWCKDGGFHIADALAFGRIAGREAAGRVNPRPEHPSRSPRG
tara:strand:+ start:174081 stop:175568 length:1488 start_codon:yes stop_codon:yes gene_type:complete